MLSHRLLVAGLAVVLPSRREGVIHHVSTQTVCIRYSDDLSYVTLTREFALDNLQRKRLASCRRARRR